MVEDNFLIVHDWPIGKAEVGRHLSWPEILDLLQQNSHTTFSNHSAELLAIDTLNKIALLLTDPLFISILSPIARDLQ